MLFNGSKNAAVPRSIKNAVFLYFYLLGVERFQLSNKCKIQLQLQLKSCLTN